MDDEAYFAIGKALGIIPAALSFFASWWYCAVTYGYLLGFGLGWLPSLILAAIVLAAFAFLWGVAVLGVVFLFLHGDLQPLWRSVQGSDFNQLAAENSGSADWRVVAVTNEADASPEADSAFRSRGAAGGEAADNLEQQADALVAEKDEPDPAGE